MIKLLLKLAVAAVVANAAVRLGAAYLVHVQFRDTVRQELARSGTEDELQQRVLDVAVAFEVPQELEAFTVERQPRQVFAEGQYVKDIMMMPGFAFPWISGRDPRGTHEIAVNDYFMSATGVRIGDTISVTTGYDPQLRTHSDSRRMLVTGRVRFLYGAANQLATAVNLATLQEMGGPERADDASLFMIKVRDDADVEASRLWIEREVPEVSAISIETALAQVDQRLSYFRQLALILGTVSLFVGFLLVTTLVTVSVNERIGEIAVMRALGVSKAHVVQQIVLEGVVITLAGALAGLALGLVTARYLNSILASFPGLPVAIDFFLFQPRAAWTALGMLSLSGILAGVYPSLRAASLPIATTLREEAIA